MNKYPMPLIEQRADPQILRHTDGYYYFAATVPEYDRIEIRRAKTINELASAPPKIVWKKHNVGEMSKLIWAPEIHFIKGEWLIYFAAGHTMEVLDHRMYVLSNFNEDPFEGEFIEAGRIDTGSDTFALDATTFVLNDEQYLVWAEQAQFIEGHSNIYIARMETPVKLATRKMMLTYPEYDWESIRFKVNEGPYIIMRNNRIFMTYSASGVGREYCMGLLWANIDSDILNPKSWTKSKEPVFQTSDQNGMFGPGHNAFTVAEDGETDLLVYHARQYEEVLGDPLFDPNRHTFVQPFGWDEEGMPVFGVPGGGSE